MIPTGQDSLHTRSTLEVGGKTYSYYSLPKAAEALGDISRLPFSMKVLLENLLRYEDGKTVTRDLGPLRLVLRARGCACLGGSAAEIFGVVGHVRQSLPFRSPDLLRHRHYCERGCVHPAQSTFHLPQILRFGDDGLPRLERVAKRAAAPILNAAAERQR